MAGEHDGRESPAERLDAARERAAGARQAAGRRADEARQAAGRRAEETRKRAVEARQAAAKRAEEARQRALETRHAATERAGEARDAAIERLEGAGEALAEARRRDEARVKPRLRGVTHQWAFFASLAAGAALLIGAAPDARVALGIYAFSLSALLGTSAVYHRVTWQRQSARRWMRRLDHAMIFVLIAGTVTPFAVLVMDDGLGEALLIAVWAAAAAGIVVELVWVEAPKWISALVYVIVGVVAGAVGFPAIISESGIAAGSLIAIGGALYGVGALVYARQSPDPNPAVFGYHEIFHVLVIAAAAVQFAAVAIYAA